MVLYTSKNDDYTVSYMQNVREKYKDAHSDRGKQIQFESDKIKLNIPTDGTVVNGWKIIPLKTPEVSL